MPEHTDHRYHVTCRWNGSTGIGYDHYVRTHEIGAAPAEATLKLSGDPAFRGDPTLLNPEQLLVMAAASCQLLSFLAVAARRRLDVVAYEDHAEGFMPEHDKPVRVTHIVLKPRIVVKGPADEAAVRKAVAIGHEQCFIANSLKTDIQVEPQIVIQA
ncbi:MAG TPA: OsmC family protein [Gammaproteobacteria bacterium]|jgi:organic hydroperoxide reductase OsmC/OhrA